MTIVGRSAALAAFLGLLLTGSGRAQDTISVRASGDSVKVRFVESDLRAVVQALGRYSPKPVIASGVPGVRVTLETPVPVPRADVIPLLRGLLEANGLELTEKEAFYQVAPRAAAPPAAAATAPGPASPIQLYVVRLKHARATDVAATINQLFGGGGEFSGRSGSLPGTLSDELRRNTVPLQGVAAPTPAPESHGASLAGPTVIVPDELTNSLLVRASEADFAVLRQAVEQLDIRPLQVLIEVLIVEARRDRSFSLGADLSLAATNLDGATISGDTRGGGLGDVVIQLMGLARGKVDALLRAAQSRGDVEIISRPVLLASNNTESRFLVGSQRPFVQVSRSLPTDTPTRDQVVQYRDVGTKLTVRPTINQDGYVSLLLQQEINQATGETQFDAPVISTREATTQVLVRDGQTIMLGGLRDQQKDRTHSGVPILSGIPIIGGLFGGVSRHDTSTELYLFLTPRILRTDADADSITAPHLPSNPSAGVK